jgi:very-short-patch-repair endonuclease
LCPLLYARSGLWTTGCGPHGAAACSLGMNITQKVYRLGGVTDRSTLVRLTSRAQVETALKCGEIVRDGRGRYAVPVADRGLRAAHAVSGVLSHRSAALYWGWELKCVPPVPDVTVPRNRNIDPERRRGLAVHWARLGPEDVVDGRVTSRERTLVDCLRSLPFDEALAIADSALRHLAITHARLIQLAASVRGPGGAACRRVAHAANGKAANPFESVLRAISFQVPGLDLQPQVVLAEDPILRPDLVDARLRVVAEADSFEWHSSRSALKRDCRRYNRLVLLGWHLLRFAWEDVMHDPDYVRACLIEVVQQREQVAPTTAEAA